MRIALAALIVVLHLPDGHAREKRKPVEDIEAGGRHFRLETDRGPVHVWMPATYRAESAGIALYVHGYYTDVDRAWKEHRLAEQFAASGKNALFIAPEAPSGLGRPVNWPVLGELLIEVRRQTGLRRPWGPVVGVFHSGAYRTAASWLDHRALEQVMLLDGLYGEEEAFLSWIRQPPTARRSNRIALVGADTLRWTEPFARDAAAAGLAVSSYDQLPARPEEISAPERDAAVLYFRSGASHMELVEKGISIPLLFQLTRLGDAAASR